MSFFVTLAADVMVAVLLVATILSSRRLSQRIAGLKADEAAMRQTIGDLVVATSTAERAIAGLRAALAECDKTLAERLDNAERSCTDLAAHVAAGEGVIARIGAIVTQSQGARASEPRRTVLPAPAASPAQREQMPQSAMEQTVSAAVLSNGDRLGAALAAAQAISERALERIRARAA